MSSFGKRTLDKDSDSQESNGPKRSRSPASHEPSTSCESSPTSCESSPASNVTSDEEDILRVDYSDKLIIDLTGDSDEDEDVNCPPQAVDMEDHYSCSEIGRKLLRHLSVKHFLVDHDYILFPYCITDKEGRREKPSLTRVSKIIESRRDDKRYREVVEILQDMDTVVNKDTSTIGDVFSLADKVSAERSEIGEKIYTDFMYLLKNLLQKFINRTDREANYRSLFAAFLRIVCSRLKSVLIMEQPQVEENVVSFPNWNKRTTISGKPDIAIRKYEGNRDSTLSVIECKRYREMKFMFQNAEIKDENDLQKALPRVRFCKVVRSSGNIDEARKKRILERMYKDLDASICRALKRDEKTYFGCFLAQLVGEILAWYNTSDEIPVLMPLEARDKSVKYGIGQLGFKIIFITVGINNRYMEKPPHIRIGERKGMGLDVFLTRPFDLMIADDRAKVRDILFAMMAMAWMPAKVK